MINHKQKKAHSYHLKRLQKVYSNCTCFSSLLSEIGSPICKAYDRQQLHLPEKISCHLKPTDYMEAAGAKYAAFTTVATKSIFTTLFSGGNISISVLHLFSFSFILTTFSYVTICYLSNSLFYFHWIRMELRRQKVGAEYNFCW